MNKLPLIIKVPVPQTRFDPDAVDMEVWCLNRTSETWLVTVTGDSFITLDETTGVAAEDNALKASVQLAPGASAKVAEVCGWEWDGAVALFVKFHSETSGSAAERRYNLKSSSADIEFDGKRGRVVEGR